MHTWRGAGLTDDGEGRQRKRSSDRLVVRRLSRETIFTNQGRAAGIGLRSTIAPARVVESVVTIKSGHMPSVSVIIPTFNRRDLLRRAVESVAAQSFRDYEILIIDDGSSDGTSAADLFKSFPRPASYMRLPENRGVSAARNAGISAARGAWLAFLDSDDVWHPRKLERQIDWLQSNPGCRIAQTREIWIRKGRRVNPPATHEKARGDLFEAGLERCMITPSSVIMQKSLVDECGAFDESLPACEDYDLWLRITARYRVGLIDEYLLTRYGGRPDQLSVRVPALDRFRVRALIKLLTTVELSERRRALVCRTLTKKARIIAAGCRKRNKGQEYEHYRRIAEHFANIA